MNTEIDWGKAPEGTTHWEMANGGVLASWMKFENQNWYFWPAPNAHTRKQWYLCDVGPSRIPHIVPRPTESVEWNGDGLPLVGTECEVYFPKDTHPEWYKVKVMYLSEYMTVFFGDGEENSYTLKRLKDLEVEFRPIRTPEQIAAEEQENVISEMVKDVESLTGRVGFSDQEVVIFSNLAAAGYRKVTVADHG